MPVPVPVVQIWPMRMAVAHGLVLVRVAMPHPRGQAGVHVGVVPVVVPMIMRVAHGLVRMLVPVFLDHEEGDAGGKEQGRHTVHQGKALAQR